MSHGHEIPTETKHELVDIPGVVSVGESTENGRTVIVVGISSRVEADLDAIPEEVLGHPTRVEVTGSFELGHWHGADPDTTTTSGAPVDDRVRPVQPGTATGRAGRYAVGTMGPVLTDGERSYLTSNQHVHAPVADGEVIEDAKPGDQITQPFVPDVQPDDVVGYLADWTDPADVEDHARTDMAWSQPDDDVEIDPSIYGLDIDAPTGVKEPEAGDELVYHGRTTGRQEVTVDQLGAVIQLPYHDIGSVRYENQVIFTPPPQGGDSGSAIVTRDGGEAVGVLFAGSDEAGAFNTIQDWAGVSGLSVVTAGQEPPRAYGEEIPSPEQPDRLLSDEALAVGGLLLLAAYVARTER